MTMRLDIVTNDAGELVRREHARELGAGVVVAIYRLAKLAQVHDLQNQAFTRQLEQTHQIIGDYCLRSGSNVNVLFAHKAVFVAGQLLKGNRGAYEAASELGELFEKLGGSELFIQRDVTRDEMYAFAEQISNYFRTGAQFRLSSPRIRLRPVTDAARLRGIELEVLSADQRIIRAYASAVVIMRRFFEDLLASKYILPRRIKRIAQSLVDLSDASTAAFLGVTEVRNANFDEAGRAVNTAILAVSIARETTADRTTLSQIAMAAMMHDVARPRALALAASGGPAMPGMQGPTTLSEDQEDRLAAGAAAVLTALGRVNEPSITRTVLAFEALWLRRQTWLGPVYWGARAPTLHATMIAIARRYNDLLTPEPGLAPPTPDFAVATLANELRDPIDRTVLRMLVSALGLLPVGTVVQLSTGEVAEVIRGARGLGERPLVRVMSDANGATYAQQVDIDLAVDTRRTVIRILSVDGWRKGLADAPQADGPPPDSDQQGDRSDAPPPPVAAMPPPAHISPLSPVLSPANHVGSAPPARSIAAQVESQFASWGARPGTGVEAENRESSSMQSAEHNSSASLPSLGSSPSAVAEAMGRMINDSLRPPAPPKESERTVFQQGPNEAPAATSPSQRPAREPTARGNLAATPLPHVLVYMLDHSLSGSVIFEGTGSNEAIYFVRGVPTKIRLAEPIAPLGQTLVHGGALDPRAIDQAVEGARRLGILLGEYLVGHDLVTREMLAWGLEAQLLQKIAYIANLAPEVEYSYHRDVDMLDTPAGEIQVTAALNPILASVRNWTDRARVRATLNRIGKHPLVVHPDAELTNLAVMPEEQTILDAIQGESMPLQQLYKQKLADEEVVSSLVYSLAVTRQFAFKGQKKGPMAARGTAWKNPAPGSSGNVPAISAPVATPSAPSMASGSRPSPAARRAQSAPAIAVNAAPVPQTTPPGSGQAKRPHNPPAVGTPSRAPQPSSPSLRPASSAPRSGAPLVRASAPQVRPMTAKKATAHGLQPAAPPEARYTASRPPPDRPSSPPDDAKTIALVSPAAVQEAIAKARAAASATPAHGPASAVPPAAPAAPGDLAMTEEIEVDVDVSASEPESDLENEETDPRMADAESALEAMSAYRLAEQALARNDAKTALLLAEKAVLKDPSQPDYGVLVAWIKSLAGNPKVIDDAIGVMTRAIKDDPTSESPRFFRAKLYVKTNKLQEALKDFNELLALNPNHKEAATEARVLKSRIK